MSDENSSLTYESLQDTIEEFRKKFPPIPVPIMSSRDLAKAKDALKGSETQETAWLPGLFGMPVNVRELATSVYMVPGEAVAVIDEAAALLGGELTDRLLSAIAAKKE